MFSFGKKADRNGVVLDVNQGIIVTGRVNGDVILVGGQRVPLTELKLPWRPAKKTVESLLSWKSRITTLVGRDVVRDELINWALNKETSLSVRLLHGPGGSGKTRLASEIAETLRQLGWAAGYVDVEKPMAFLPGENGTLLLVDYPEERPEIIEKLMGCLGAMDEPKQPLRLLLLSRHGVKFWSEILKGSNARELVDPSILIPPIPSDDPWVLFLLAVEGVCDVLEMPTNVTKITSDQFNRWLMLDPLHLQPLFIISYAVQLAYEPGSWRLKGGEIMDSIAARECLRWRRESENAGMDQAVLERLRGLASILGALNAEQLRVLASDTALGLQLPKPEEIVDCVDRTGEMENHQLPGIEPDLLAISVLVGVLEDSHDKAGEWLRKLLDVGESPVTALERMGRLAYDAVHTLGYVWPAEALANVVAGQVGWCGKFCEPLSRQMAPLKDITPALLPLATSVYRTLVDAAEDDVERAGISHKLFTCLHQAGRNEEALVVIQQSVVIYERLAAQQPEKYEAEWVRHIMGVSAGQFAVGRTEDALESAQQAVFVLERLAAREPEAHEKVLAAALFNLSFCLVEVGCNEEALEVTQRSVVIYERLAAQQPEKYEPLVAAGLSSLSHRLITVGGNETALEVSQRAVAIAERLAEQQPEAYEGMLANTLNSLSHSLFMLGRIDDALEVMRRIITIYEHLVALLPEAHEKVLAGALFNLSFCLVEVGRNEEALVVTQRSVVIYERLAAKQPEANEAGLVRSLCGLAHGLRKSGRVDDALEVMQQIVAVYESLAAQFPEIYGERLFDSLNSLAIGLKEAGHDDKALQASQRAQVVQPKI